jgi:predicted DCC family thiol-disulfide oxidoreductase YuxK
VSIAVSERAVAEGARAVVFFDGVCGFCDRLVQFVLAHDKADRFRFAALQSPYAAAILGRHGKIPTKLDTFYLVVDAGTPEERVLERARAGLRVLEMLGGIYRLAVVLRVFPTPLLNVGYDAIARVRYRLFGKLDVCRVPTAEERAKFLDA